MDDPNNSYTIRRSIISTAALTLHAALFNMDIDDATNLSTYTILTIYLTDNLLTINSLLTLATTAPVCR